ncbi:hypothetical protein RU07_06855 [Agrobacterium tumefaciens]|uniref:Uncharacterized protein n=1 Tax=Agrobacterium tumefaciens TaxID=358 RepID=A0A0D0K5D2_AGRTU|nr:hypothetical protein RU07_06855 [Agrobacterium tumefaciens]
MRPGRVVLLRRIATIRDPETTREKRLATQHLPIVGNPHDRSRHFMTNYSADTSVVSEIATLRLALPTWIVSTVELVELSENAERAARTVNPETDDKARELIVEVAEWQQELVDWQKHDLSPRLKAELRILKATLDASMDEANAAASRLGLS